MHPGDVSVRERSQVFGRGYPAFSLKSCLGRRGSLCLRAFLYRAWPRPMAGVSLSCSRWPDQWEPVVSARHPGALSLTPGHTRICCHVLTS